MIFENESVSLSGSYSDQNLGDSHTVVVDWDDPNDSADSTFSVPAINTLSVGDTFSSTTDGATLEITGVDLLTGTVDYLVVDHQYADDGIAPGNGTPSDVQTVRVRVIDDGGLATPSDLVDFLEPVNLGSVVNTGANDVAPTLSADGLTLYFHSNRAGGSGGADIWQATRPSLTGEFSSPTNLGGVINSGAAETAPAISSDGLSLFFSSNRAGGNGSWDLYVATRTSTSEPFGAPVNLGTGVNTNLPEFAPAISADGLSLYFQRRNDPGGLGGDDVWVATRASTSDPFGTAVNLGSPVNSTSFEGGPFISDDELALYFASARPGGAGQIDLYLSNRASTGDSFGAPINLGVPINTTVQDFNAHIAPDGLYFHSNRPGGQGGNDLWFAAFAGTTTVLVKNVAPEITLDPVVMINENEAATLTGMIIDQGLLDEHDMVIEWDDPNASADATFALPATTTLSVGDTFSSTTDGAILEVTAVDLSIGKVSFSVQHVYADDGLAPGNATSSDISTISAEVTDDDLGSSFGLESGPIYTTEANGTRLGTIDPATGVGTDIGPFGTTTTWAAAFGTDGTLYTIVNGFTSSATLASVDQSTGAATTIGSGLGTAMLSLEVAADGTMYGIGYTDRILYEIDQTTGTTTAIGNTGIFLSMDLAFDSSGTLYATVNNNIYTVDRTTGASTLLGSLTGVLSGSVMGIMFDENDTLFATAFVSNSPLYEIDLNTLSATVIGNIEHALCHRDRQHGLRGSAWGRHFRE
jgi:hypothetical protein